MEKISRYDALERFAQEIDECYEPVLIMGIPRDPAHVFQEVDPIMYNEMFNNWLDAEGLELED
jgi:hypothetical protein